MTEDGVITLYLAASVDGFIADADGGVEWLEGYGGGETQTRYEAFVAEVDCLVVGSRTYQQLLGFGAWPYGDTPTYVATSRDLPRATDAVTLVDDPVDALAARLISEHDHVWLVGGAALARAFLATGRVDELRLTVVPVVLGGGVALFDGSGDRWELTLLEAVTLDGSLVELRYGVVD